MKNTLPKYKAIELRTSWAGERGFSGFYSNSHCECNHNHGGLFVCGLWAL